MQYKKNTITNEYHPLISFVIPAYNVPVGMLIECVKSILKLSLRPFERQLIVVDDGSDNSPLEALLKLSDDILYIRQKNSGVSAARNTGLVMAQGEYVQFVDADDTLVQRNYEHVLDLLRYSQVDMVMFDFSNSPVGEGRFTDQPPLAGVRLLRQQNIHGSACAYAFKRAILGSLRFTPGIAYGEDEEFTPQLLLRAEHVCKSSTKAYYYRRRQSSATNHSDMRSRLRRLNDAKTVIFSLNSKCVALPPPERAAIQRRTAQLTMDYIYNVIVATRSRHYLDRRLDELSRAGLFPLPDRKYTKKYTWFRRLTGSSLGLAFLLRTLPLINKKP